MGVNYETIWDQYWDDLLKNQGGAFWDKNLSIRKEDILFLKDQYDSSLPLIDLGCGTGHRTNLLSSFHPNVIGIDISDSVIAHAENAYPTLQFQKVDILDTDQRNLLLERLGSVNIYCRGVLHQLAQEDRPGFISAIAQLGGGKGVIYLQEMSLNFKKFISEKYRVFSDTPMPIKKILFSKFSPQPLDEKQTTKGMNNDGYQLMKKGTSSLNITLTSSEDSQLEVPAIHLLYTPELH